MTYYADLAPCDYFRRWSDTLVAVGWLDPAHPYETGIVDTRTFEAIAELVAKPRWEPIKALGVHRCELGPSCDTTRGIVVAGTAIAVGASNVVLRATG